MVLMQLTVPDASFPGDQITVSAGGEEFLVTVPNGVGPGSLIEVDLPLASEQAAPEAQLNQRVQVTIPENCRAGEPFSVQAPWGGVFEVVVPEGLLPGDFLEVELPTEQVAQLAAEATAPAGEEPITPAVDGALEGADAYAGMHRIGAHVSVLRSNGSYSPGTIKEYDELSDTYTLELPGGLLKYLVNEDEIAPLNHEPDKAGEHFIGRRVQVPMPGAESRDEVMGAIRGYDQCSGLYTVEMDSGRTRRDVRADQIRVRQKKQS